MVLADGCFDPLHLGHIRYLRAAAALGRPLVVNLAPDEAITAKGRGPFQLREKRMAMVLALDMVDHVIAEPLMAAILARKPQIVVKGSDWRGRLPAEIRQACQIVGAEIHYTDTQDRTSTERLTA